MKLNALARILPAALLCACLCACGPAAPAPSPAASPSAPSPAVSPAASSAPAPAASAPAEAVLLPAETPGDFTFASGVGAWSTELTLAADGSFTGQFHDSDMGDSGAGYPNGTVYYCDFRGQFGEIARVDEHTYTMTLLSLTQETPPDGTAEINRTDGIRYVASYPYGLSEVGSTYRLYLPDTPLAGLSEEFLSWWPLRFDPAYDKAVTLSCWGICNEKEEYGFFAFPESASNPG